MKKFLAVLLAMSMTLALAACGGGNPPAASTPAGSGSGAGSSAAASTPAGSGYKVAMICDSSISDGGWGAACYNAMMDAATELGWETAVSDTIAQSDYASSMTSYCDLGYNLIFAPGNQYTTAVQEVAAQYPDVDFALLNGAEDVPTDNITSILPDADQIGYMAGALAGLMSQTKTLGFIGGMEIDTTKQKLAGYEAAAKAVDPSIEVLSAYAGSFNDTAKGMELAKGMIDKNADVFFGDASVVDTGARQAVDQANTDKGDVSVFDIGQPADLLGQNPCIIGSVVTDNAGMLKLAMEAVEDGSFGNAVIYGNLENDCLSVGKISEDLVPLDVQEQYLALVDQIKAGAFPG